METIGGFSVDGVGLAQSAVVMNKLGALLFDVMQKEKPFKLTVERQEGQRMIRVRTFIEGEASITS